MISRNFFFRIASGIESVIVKDQKSKRLSESNREPPKSHQFTYTNQSDENIVVIKTNSIQQNRFA